MDDFGFQEQIKRDIEARRIARNILEISENASHQELRRAWRKACKKHHPDRNPGNSDAGRRFAAINCAYRLLTCGEPCEMLFAEQEAQSETLEHDKYRLDNAWGLFLWWRDKFF